MDAKIKAEWLAALRSGKYEQARSMLYNGKGYCCIGVLCSIQGADDADLRNERTSQAIPGMEAGLSRDEMELLAGRNDNRDTFEQIADFIERTH